MSQTPADAVEHERGYRDQREWLDGKTVDEARIALAARHATAALSPYNAGGTKATEDYIAERGGTT